MNALHDVYRQILRARVPPAEVVVSFEEYKQICHELGSLELTKARGGLAVMTASGEIAFATEPLPQNVLVSCVPVRPE